MKRSFGNWPFLLLLVLFVGTGAWLTWEIVNVVGNEDDGERAPLFATNQDNEDGDAAPTMDSVPALHPKPTKPRPETVETPENVPPLPPSAIAVPGSSETDEPVVPPKPYDAEALDDTPGPPHKTGAVPFQGRPRHDTTGGRVALPRASGVLIGTPRDIVKGLVERHPLLEALGSETPVHRRDIPGFLIDRMEVSNAQYLLYLQDVTREQNNVSLRSVRAPSMVAWAASLLDPAYAPDNGDMARFAQQIGRTTPGLFSVAAAPARDDPASVHESDWAKWLSSPPPRRSVNVPIVRRLPPKTWTSLFPSKAQMNLPVRGVSFHEALAFADWAGKHIPTEYEWEYAARGKNGRAFPWGGTAIGWHSYVHQDAESRDEADIETLPIDQLPEGATPEDVRHLLGNVSEWTSSFLDPYPGGFTHPLRYRVRVVRGGSVASMLDVFLRSTCRAWSRESDDPDPIPVREGTPYANKRLPWTGFRCGSFDRHPGASYARNMMAWAASSPFAPWVILPDRVHEHYYDGYFWRDHALKGQPVESGVFVREGAQWIAAMPLKTISLLETDGAATTAVDETTREGFIARSHGHGIPMALLSTSFEIDHVWVDTDRDSSTLTPKSPFGIPKKLRTTTAPPGCYVVMVHAGWIALRSTRTTAIYYLDRRARSVSKFPFTWSTRRRDWNQPPRPSIEMRDGPAAQNTMYTLKFELPVRPTNEKAGHGRVALTLRLKVKRAQRHDKRLERLKRDRNRGRRR